MTSILIDDDLLLRSYKPEDAAELFRCINESRAHLRAFLPWVDGTTRPEHSAHFIQTAIAQEAGGEGLPLGIFLQESRQLIGGIGLQHWNKDLGRGQMGYWIAESCAGRGLMRRSAERFVDFLFRKRGLNKVEMHIVPRNERSLRLAEVLGAQREGILRQSARLQSRLEDVVVMGLLRSEWEAAHGER